jgi:type I restriction enzyme S subunit
MLPEGWRTGRWGELASFEYGEPVSNYVSEGGFPVYGANGPFARTALALVHGPGVTVGRKGAYRAVKYSPTAFWAVDTAFFLKPLRRLDMRWAYYALGLHDINRLDTGSAIPSTSRADLAWLRVHIPPIEEQRAIASLLGALDDKIELNRQLQAKLRRLQFQLFQQFGDETARNGQRSQLGDHFQPVKGLSYRGDGLSSGGRPMVTLGCFLPDGGLDLGQLKPYVGDFRDRHLVFPDSVVVANTDITQRREVLGSAGQVPAWAVDGWLFTHHVFALRPTAGCRLLPSVLLGLLSSRDFRARVRGFATGTTVLALPKDALTAFEFDLPSERDQHLFRQETMPIRTRADLAFRESESLRGLREVLLPRLVTGQLSTEAATSAMRAVVSGPSPCGDGTS